MPAKECMPVRQKLSNLPDHPNLQFEQKHWPTFSAALAGLDEAGRGAWAGPVSAAAVVLPRLSTLEQALSGVIDSKLMTAKQRQVWAERIKTIALGWGVGFSSAQEIDALGILAATRLAMTRAVALLDPPPQFLLIDALTLPACALPQEALIKGDRRCLSIAAASVLAKTARDGYMCEQDQLYPAFGFAAHKGYGTQRHQQALAAHGLTPLHRLSFKPMHSLLPAMTKPRF
jgi:ribonuclease HII